MGIETYILIAVCYGLGCWLSYKLGRKHQITETVKWMNEAAARHFKVDPHELAKALMKETQERIDKNKALKS